MSKSVSPFRFKQFSVSHHRSSMKVGVDAVILGAWVDLQDAESILDVGTGCGVIALMCAQRDSAARIDALDIDSDSVTEAAFNFSNSPWGDRLVSILADFLTYMPEDGIRYDLIISNPPYFNSGVSEVDTPRLRARHQCALSPELLLDKASRLLLPGGRVAVIVPYSERDHLREVATGNGLFLNRELLVSGKSGESPKRVCLEFTNQEGSAVSIPSLEALAIEYSPLVYTPEYISLCKDFYLKF